jgi:hypothetical protein
VLNSTTGWITGTPTQAVSALVTVTAKDSSGPSNDTSFAWTITSSGGGTTATPLRFNFSGAAGLALQNTSVSGALRSSVRALATASVATAPGSNLEAISATGQVSEYPMR